MAGTAKEATLRPTTDRRHFFGNATTRLSRDSVNFSNRWKEASSCSVSAYKHIDSECYAVTQCQQI